MKTTRSKKDTIRGGKGFYTQIIEDEFFSPSLSDWTIKVTKWVWSRKFPFIKRTVVEKPLDEWQGCISKEMNRRLDAELIPGRPIGLKTYWRVDSKGRKSKS